ncbi:Vacuolar protein-sorting-associated protein 36 [Aspergillus melleus]|uniref:Vacuolar protein-sorting-associated protein 36 n=1 Tax=Aspergillus melleus TaxID=138277 RepID=A0ACC3AX63_9EURO|nr:Vacuolar protein-sorting-associated protein 36 [Aspergillus melleus]
MFFKPLDLTTALRPLLLPDETLLFVQDAVGLYEGKYKIPNYQNGHAYLTSHRVCYVAVEDPRKHSVAVDLKEIDRADYQAGFLKSSAKITIYPKPLKNGLDKSRGAGASPSRSQLSRARGFGPKQQRKEYNAGFTSRNFYLMPQIAPLATAGTLRPAGGDDNRAESPAPFFEQGTIKNTEITDCIKLSFRGGGEKTFHERLKGALIQRKWLLYDAPPVPQQPARSTPSPGLTVSAPVDGIVPVQTRSPAVGIAGLEQRGLEARRNNEMVIGNAFEDLEALMASAKQIVALAETLARESGMSNDENSLEASTVLSESAAALGMITTKDMLGSGAENLYLSELSRNLAEYLTDDRKGILQREGGIISLIDLWAIFNRSRNGVELVSPSDFQRAAELWEKLKLPVRLRRFKSGLLVVQRYDWSDEKTIRQLQEWMVELRQIPPLEPVAWDWRLFGRAVTAQEAAQRFKWSVGVAAEELEMAEDKGVLCREEGIEGLRFWSNYITSDPVSQSLDDLGVSGLVL